MNLIDQLNQQFSIVNQLSFVAGKGGLPLIDVTTRHARAKISLHGGQVLSFLPVNTEHELLFLSNNAFFQHDKAIKGGTPICWPWFGAPADGKNLPFHGFVRNQSWQVQSTECRDNDELVITLVFMDSKQTRELWPYPFELRIVITVGLSLDIQLHTHNTGTETFHLTQALHTYFSVADITQVEVTGLENKSYLDKVAQFAEKTQIGPLTVNQEVDRIYQQVDAPLVIHDAGFSRDIRIETTGSSTAVVWNPWQEISKQSSDLEDDSYQHFICVETANAANDVVTVNSDETYTIGARYSVC